ncbi:hypothetical protein ACFO3O_06305 [Dokdonia ponticola]|uniref:Uncharacterized protein n=1 Tax=Dokdonia ponticola TaxID=2041041 RepID=A0ABV9HUX2_9FLAO
MIVIDREDFLEEEELYDDFNAYGLPIRPISHRGVAPAYHPKRRKARMDNGGTRPILRPKRRRPIKGSFNILLPRKKAIAFGKPRRIPLKKIPILKVTPPLKAKELKKEITSSQRRAASATTKERAKSKAKALKKQVTQKQVASNAGKPKMSVKKKLIILALTITTVSITGYLINNAQKKDGL